MVELSKEAIGARIAKNIAALVDELAGEDTFVLNLGVGIPTQVAEYVQNDNVFIQAENGMIGVGPLAKPEEVHPMLCNAGRQPVTETPGCSYLDSSASFGLIRGGYVDATVLGAFEVDKAGNIANWIIPNGKQLGVGGAMDLVAGANRVIVAMTHLSKGKPKLIDTCTLPLTGVGEVDYVVTECCMLRRENGRYELFGLAPEMTVDELRAVTGFAFDVSPDCRPMLP